MVDSQNICLAPSITPDVLEAASILLTMKKGIRSLIQEARQAQGHFPYMDFTALPPGSPSQFHFFPRVPCAQSLYEISPIPAAYHFPITHVHPQPVAYYGMMATPPCFVGPPREKTVSSVAVTESEGDNDTLQPAAKKPRLSRTSTGSPDTATTEKAESRRKRKNLTKEQLAILEGVYAEEKYPHIEDRLKLEKPTRLTEDRIQVWFQNRRAKDRKKLESEKIHCYFDKSHKATKEHERNDKSREKNNERNGKSREKTNERNGKSREKTNDDSQKGQDLEIKSNTTDSGEGIITNALHIDVSLQK